MSNVFSIRSGIPLEEEEKLIEEETRRIQEHEDQELENERKKNLELIDRVRSLVESGRLVGLVVMGFDPVTDLPLNELQLNGPSINRTKLFAYVGMLEMLKIEVNEAAMMSPTINADGNIVDPYVSLENEDGDYEI